MLSRGLSQHGETRFQRVDPGSDRAGSAQPRWLAASPPRRILVIRSGGLGDFLLTLPTLRALGRKWPESAIEILGRPHYAQLAVESGYCEAAHNIDRAFFTRLFSQNSFRPASQRDPLATYLNRFQLVLSFLNDREGLLRHNLSSSGIPFLLVPPPHQRYHVCRQFAEAMAPIQLRHDDLDPKLLLNQDTLRKGRDLLHSRGDGKNWIAIHPGSGSPRKNWPATHFAAVARWLVQHGDSPLILVQGEADEEAVRATQAALEPHRLPVLSHFSLLNLAGLLSQCTALFGNDSGISHLAAAVGTPTVALFGPTRRLVWRPLGGHVRALRFEDVHPQAAGKILLAARKPVPPLYRAGFEKNQLHDANSSPS